MNLQVLLPSRVFLLEPRVLRIVAEGLGGSFGLLPQRLDCVVALVPGIFSYESAEAGEVFLAIDSGVLVKTGPQVRVSVRRALRGLDLAQLRAAVEREYLAEDEVSRELTAAMSRLEASFVSRFAHMQRGQRGQHG